MLGCNFYVDAVSSTVAAAMGVLPFGCFGALFFQRRQVSRAAVVKVVFSLSRTYLLLISAILPLTKVGAGIAQV